MLPILELIPSLVAELGLERGAGVRTKRHLVLVMGPSYFSSLCTIYKPPLLCKEQFGNLVYIQNLPPSNFVEPLYGLNIASLAKSIGIIQANHSLQCQL